MSDGVLLGHPWVVMVYFRTFSVSDGVLSGHSARAAAAAGAPGHYVPELPQWGSP